MPPLLLTGAVHPSSLVARSDPQKRLLDYKTAIYLWITASPFQRIIYLDASNAHVIDRNLLDAAARQNKTLTGHRFDFSSQCREFGKSYSEALLLAEGRKMIEGPFFKATGRLFVMNSVYFLKDTRECVGELPFPNCLDTRFFKCSTRVFDDVLAPRLPLIRDETEDYIESVYGQAFQWSRFLRPVKYYGISGSHGKIY